VLGARSTLLEKVTYDLERQMEGATKVSTSDFGKAIVSNI
jgi:isocitrate dehydrogenase